MDSTAPRTNSNAGTAGIRRPSTFLCLAPVHSDSYPKAPAVTTPTSPALDAAAPKPEVTATATARRSSSISTVNSDASGPKPTRFLKLGPVHWGEDDYAVEI